MAEETLQPLPGMEPTIIEKDFGTPTEHRQPSTASTASTNAITDADFTELPKKTPEDSKHTEKAPEATPKPRMSASDSAEFTVDAIDASITLTFGMSNKRKMKKHFGDKLKQARELYKDMQDGRLKKDALTDEELRLYRDMKFFMDVDEEIPLDEDEFSKLQKRFERYYQSRPDVDIPPGLALMITAMPMLAKRVADAFDRP